MRWVLGFIALLPMCLACEKTAPEPEVQRAPSTTPKSEPEAPVPDRPARHDPVRHEAACLVVTPPTPPPAPHYKVDPRCPADPAHGPPQVPMGHVAFPESKDAP